MLFLIFKFKPALILILFVKKTSQSILIENSLETCHEYLGCMSCLKSPLETITRDCSWCDEKCISNKISNDTLLSLQNISLKLII
jgi:hypothetical protein